MRNLFHRLLVFADVLFVSIINFGFWGTFLAHFVYRRKDAVDRPVAIWLPALRRHFHFRGQIDRGGLSHLYKPGYRICEKPGAHSIRYIVDAGANIGDESIRFRHYHPQATVYALEIEDSNFHVLNLNAANDAKLVPLKKALWSHDCRLTVTSGSCKEDFRVVEDSAGRDGQRVDAASLSGLMAAHHLPHIDILKMDIEGAEQEVFSGDCSDWIGKVRVFIFEPPDHEAPGTTVKIFEQLTKAGLKFHTYIHGENLVLIRADTGWQLRSELFYERNRS